MRSQSRHKTVLQRLLLSGLLFAIACTAAEAQSTVAIGGKPQSANDSVFSAATLTSFPLTRASDNHAFSLSAQSPAGILTCFVFLSPECPLCQNYTVVLNALHDRYGDRLCVYGIIPGRSYSAAAINAFSQKYKIAFPLLVDGSFHLSRYLQARTTPEAILLDDRHELVYRGAIDNWVKELGKRSARPTENYLRDAIDQGLKKEPVAEKRIRPVGCLINDI